MSEDLLKIPTISRFGTKVTVDRHVFEAWRARDLEFPWTWSQRGPYVRDPGGRPQFIADVITGKATSLGKDGPWSVALSNLHPADGTPATTAGLDAIPTNPTN